MTTRGQSLLGPEPRQWYPKFTGACWGVLNEFGLVRSVRREGQLCHGERLFFERTSVFALVNETPIYVEFE